MEESRRDIEKELVLKMKNAKKNIIVMDLKAWQRGDVQRVI